MSAKYFAAECRMLCGGVPGEVEGCAGERRVLCWSCVCMCRAAVSSHDLLCVCLHVCMRACVPANHGDARTHIDRHPHARTLLRLPQAAIQSLDPLSGIWVDNTGLRLGSLLQALQPACNQSQLPVQARSGHATVTTPCVWAQDARPEGQVSWKITVPRTHAFTRTQAH